MNKEEKIKTFDPNGIATGDGIFGLPFNLQESETVIFPVPWEVTVSYSSGTAEAPEAVWKASRQVDLYDPVLKDAWKRGIYMLPADEKLKELSDKMRPLAEKCISALEEGETDTECLDRVNKACAEMIDKVDRQSSELLESGKRVALLGGDHSTPLGYIRAVSRKNPGIGILQIDAHADLRKAYEGFEYSHASIMYNALKEPGVAKLVQVGIRDYCEEEVRFIEDSAGRVVCFYDRDLRINRFRGMTWADQCDAIIEELPPIVYLSFDIDGLDPKLCPNTGTPVAGGFEMEEVLFLLEKLALSGRRLIGLDLNEISPGGDEWDANVGARLLYKLCNLMTLSADEQQKI